MSPAFLYRDQFGTLCERVCFLTLVTGIWHPTGLYTLNAPQSIASLLLQLLPIGVYFSGLAVPTGQQVMSRMHSLGVSICSEEKRKRQ